MILFLIEEQKADINKVVVVPESPSRLRGNISAISFLIPISELFSSSISEKLLSTFFAHGFDPRSRHPYLDYSNIPWLDLQTQIALRKATSPDPQNLALSNLYIKIHQYIALPIRSAIFTSFSSPNYPLTPIVLLQIIYEYADLSENLADSQPLNRFVGKSITPLLIEEIKQYNREVRESFCIGLFSKKNNRSPLQNIPKSHHESQLSYKNAISLVFQFTGVDQSDEDKLYDTIKNDLTPSKKVCVAY